MATNEGGRKDGQFLVVSNLPDVCKTPPNGQPVPYSIVGKLEDTVHYSGNVRFTGKFATTMASRVTQVTGNEAGSLGGVKSGVNTNHCRPVEDKHSTTVRVNGHPVLCHGGLMYMNCAGAEGPYNTLGKIVYQGPSGSATASPEGQPPPGDPPVVPETPLEKSFCGTREIGKKLMNAEGVVGLAQMAPQLATTDWSDPGAALGAISGVAGLSGLGSIAQTAGLAAQGVALAQTDWRNPTAVLGAVGGVAGLGGLNSVAQATNFAAQGINLAQADWKNAGAIVGAANNLAGLGQLALSNSKT